LTTSEEVDYLLIDCIFMRLYLSNSAATGSHLRRDKLSSIASSEQLKSTTISVTLQSADPRHGILGQKYGDFGAVDETFLEYMMLFLMEQWAHLNGELLTGLLSITG
jgi:hypothetical protein